MKKHLVMALVAMFATFTLSSCGDDEPDSNLPGQDPNSASVKALNQLKNNQMTFGNMSQINVVRFNLGIRSANPSGDDEGAYYVSIEGVDDAGRMISCGMDIGSPMVGKEIDLRTSACDKYNHQFYLDMTVSEILSSGEWGIASEVYYEYESWYDINNSGRKEFTSPNKTCFKEGRIKTVHNKDGFSVTINGTVQDGTVIALKASIPENEIQVW